MNVNKLIHRVYLAFSQSSVDGLYRKTNSILTDRLMNEPILHPLTGETFAVFQAIKPQQARILQRQLTRDLVKRFLLSQPSYARAQPPAPRTQFKWTIPGGRHIKWQMDLLDVRNLPLDPSIQYLLTIIDMFSKYAFAIPLASKHARHVAHALDQLFSTKYQLINPFRPKSS